MSLEIPNSYFKMDLEQSRTVEPKVIDDRWVITTPDMWTSLQGNIRNEENAPDAKAIRWINSFAIKALRRRAWARRLSGGHESSQMTCMVTLTV